MAVHTTWFDVQHTIIRVAFCGKWTWDELYIAFDMGLNMSNSVNYAVYAVAIHDDEIARQHVPPNIIAHFPNLARRIPDNVCVQIIVLSELSPFWRNLYQSIKSMYPSFTQRMVVAESQEEALQIIQNLKGNHALARDK